MAYRDDMSGRLDMSLEYVQSERQAAHIYMRAFANSGSSRHVARLIGFHDMSSLSVADVARFWAGVPTAP